MTWTMGANRTAVEAAAEGELPNALPTRRTQPVYAPVGAS